MGLIYIDYSKNAATVQMKEDYTFFGLLPGIDYHFVKPQHHGDVIHEM